MSRTSKLALLASAAGVVLAVLLAPRYLMGPEPSVRGTVSLADSLEPLREELNGHADRPRILALLSPSCPRCFDGARSVEALLESSDDLRVAVVWSRRLAWDLPQKVRKRNRELFDGDERAAFFWDPADRASLALAGALDWPPGTPPWDVYLVFAPGARWDEEPPAPLVWFHQHRGDRHETFRSGEGLLAALRDAVERAAAEAPAS